MTYEEAKKTLDQIRRGEGSFISQAEIRLALWLTGDARPHEAMRSQRVDQEVQSKDWRYRCRERAIVVGESKR